MAGRGVFIVVQLLDGATGAVEEMSLPVALHAPLEVLKDQLFEATSIPKNSQVIILCDLSDKERNKDTVLMGMDFLSLRDCGVKSGSTLTLHSLGMTTELKKKILQNKQAAEAAAVAAAARAADVEKKYTLATRKTAAEANHSYAGVIFDVHVKGPHEVDITSFAVGGMLGRVRIYARSASWQVGPDPYSPNMASGWTLVADAVMRPSWDRHFQIPLKEPFRMLPHRVHGFYIHSSLPGDLGIQYQSYQQNEIVCADEHLMLTPGIGHAVRHDVPSCEPFDQHDSWYRNYRCMAGTVTYKARRKGWSPFTHRIFPKEMRLGVVAMLHCQLRDIAFTRAPFSLLSDKFIVYNILEFCHWDWFDREEDEEEEESDQEEENLRRPMSASDHLRAWFDQIMDVAQDDDSEDDADEDEDGDFVDEEDSVEDGDSDESEEGGGESDSPSEAQDSDYYSAAEEGS